jgi:hypothetical protein
MNQVVQKVAANASEELSGQANEMQSMINRFQLSKSRASAAKPASGMMQQARLNPAAAKGRSRPNGAMHVNPQEIILLDNDAVLQTF